MVKALLKVNITILKKIHRVLESKQEAFLKAEKEVAKVKKLKN